MLEFHFRFYFIRNHIILVEKERKEILAERIHLLKRQHAATPSNGAEPSTSYAATGVGAAADPSSPPVCFSFLNPLSHQVDQNETSDSEFIAPKSLAHPHTRRISAMSADSVKKNIDRDQRIMHRTGSLHKYLPTESRAFIPESQSARYLAHNQSIESHDCNPIYEVSNEFMKVQGYGPQFQNFLKSPRRRSEFTDLQSLTVDDGRGVGMPENGPLTVTRLANGQLVTCAKEPEVVVDAFSHRQHSLEIKREHSKRRLLRGSDEVKREFQQARQRLCVRKRMFWQRAFLCRMSIAMATIGILLMVIDSELCAANYFDKVKTI